MKQFWTGVYGTYILKQNVSYLLKSLVIIMQKYTDNHCSYYTSYTIEEREQILIVRWMLHYLQFSQLSDLVLIYQQVFRKCQIIGCKNEMLTEMEQEKIYLFWLHFRRRKKEKWIRNTWLMKGKRIQLAAIGLPNPAQVVVDLGIDTKLASQCTACTPGDNALDLSIADDRGTRVPLVTK